MGGRFLKFWGALAAGVLMGASVFASEMPQVKVTEGALSGKAAGGVHSYLGVPFAAPPVGARRWAPPEAPKAWSGMRSADRFAPNCQQALTPEGFGPWTPEYVAHGEVSEDCLYLNIWKPEDGEDLPVFVWIHGGGFSSGSGSVPIYNGAALAERGTIVVTINYRVGAYGFMAHPELTAESPHGASGNYGLLDQVEALRWVRTNIGAFGGDPDRVTIAGQSAGAASVHHLIASPLATGLFHQAIAQSGSGMGIALPGLAEGEALGTALQKKAGAKYLAALRALPAEEIDAAVQGGPRYRPIIDGRVLPDAAFAGANTNDTPILTGLTANEMTGLNPAYGTLTLAQWRSQVKGTYGALADELLTLYPAATDEGARSASDALARDRGLAALYFWAEERVQGSDEPVYAYLFAHVEPGPESERYKAFHSSEIPYVFGTLDTSDRPFTDLDRDISEQLMSYWAAFIASGDPNNPDVSDWPRLDADARQILEMNDVMSVRPVLSDAKLDFFRRYVADGGRVSLF